MSENQRTYAMLKFNDDKDSRSVINLRIKNTECKYYVKKQR